MYRFFYQEQKGQPVMEESAFTEKDAQRMRKELKKMGRYVGPLLYRGRIFRKKKRS